MEVLTQDTIWKLTGCVQHYPWGGKKYIPQLVCLANEEDEPFAELWFGQHPACPSMMSAGSTLADFMATSPEVVLSSSERKTWGDELPFLCKILDVQNMLSIQIHPDQQQAREGYLREDEQGINPSAPHRTFRDTHHKPELMYALSEFYLLHDFRSDEEVIETLTNIPTLGEVLRFIQDKGLPDFYRWYMALDQSKIYDLLHRFVQTREQQEIPEDMSHPDYWVRKAIDQFCTPRKIDRGILSFYLMNLVRLQPGEVVFQDSGIPHAYLYGQNVEVMANSDNVIRGGLTSKYIDSEALSQMVRFDERSVHRLTADRVDESRVVFTPPAKEFRLSVIDLEPYQPYTLELAHVALMFSTCNCIRVQSAIQEIRVGGGEAVLVRAGERVTVQSRKSAQVFVVDAQK